MSVTLDDIIEGLADMQRAREVDRDAGEFTISDVMRGTGMSRTQVTTLLERLVDEGKCEKRDAYDPKTSRYCIAFKMVQK